MGLFISLKKSGKTTNDGEANSRDLDGKRHSSRIRSRAVSGRSSSGAAGTRSGRGRARRTGARSESLVDNLTDVRKGSSRS